MVQWTDLKNLLRIKYLRLESYFFRATERILIFIKYFAELSSVTVFG